MEIKYEDYRKIENNIDNIHSMELLEKTHKSLIGKTITYSWDEDEKKDCALEFIERFLTRDWGRSIVYEYSNGATKFIQSNYVSDYFKTTVINLFSTKINNNEVNKNMLESYRNAIIAASSNKRLDEIEEKDLKAIFDALVNYQNTSANKYETNYVSIFLSLLYKLDGKNISTFIKNNISKYSLAHDILTTSGLSSRASYYARRGVNYGDLNSKNLFAIYNKLNKIDKNYAKEFISMVNNMNTLGATEFITTFYDFADNNFSVKNLIQNDNNLNLEDANRESLPLLLQLTIVSTMTRDSSHDDYGTRNMKLEFNSKIKYQLREEEDVLEMSKDDHHYSKRIIKRK